MKTKLLQLSEIHLDSGTQTRAWTNEEAVSDYAERMREGDKFPPIDVFFDGKEYHCADGFHRILASHRCEFKDIVANIHSGTVADAVWFAIGANRSNGIKRTAGDKRNAVRLALEKFPEKTQEAIAAHVGCAQSYVVKVKSELITSDKLSLPATRVGKDGKSRPTTYKKAEVPEPEPEPDQFQPKQVVGSVAPEAGDENPAEETAENLHSWNVALEEIKSLFAMLPAEFQAEFLAWAKEQTR